LVNSKQVTASNAATTATNAANTATTKATEASTSASAANSARIAAEAALDSFDDRYLGQKSSNPTADNDGGALLVGALYFRTTAPIGMKVWTGTAWDDAYANLSSKFDKTGGAISGSISVAGNVLATSGAIGYGVGAGGTVIQGSANGKNTPVALNKLCGKITMDSQTLAPGATATFDFSNSTIGPNSMLFVQTEWGVSSDIYSVRASVSPFGSASISLKNESTSNQTDAVSLRFFVFNGVVS
jgi:hypothetical protein